MDDNIDNNIDNNINVNRLQWPVFEGFMAYNALGMIADYSYYMLESIYHILRLIIPSTEAKKKRNGDKQTTSKKK